MKLNIALVFGGLILFLTGLYRIAPIRTDNKAAFTVFLIQTVPLFLALLVAMGWAWKIYGKASVSTGFLATMKTTSSFLPSMLCLFPVMALGSMISLHYNAEITEMLTGVGGYFGTLFASFAVPTTNAAAGPVVENWSNPTLRPMILYFLTSAALVCWPIFFFRCIGLSWEIGIQMYKVNWIVAICILPGFWLWGKAIAYGGVMKAVAHMVSRHTVT